MGFVSLGQLVWKGVHHNVRINLTFVVQPYTAVGRLRFVLTEGLYVEGGGGGGELQLHEKRGRSL